MSDEVKASVISGGAGLAGTTLAGIFNARENRLAFERQKELNKQQYEDMISYGRSVGATPTSLVQGITKGAMSSMPTSSTGGNPVPDIGQSVSSGVSAGAAVGQSIAANTSANSQRDINLMKLRFEPMKYFADIRKSLSVAFKNTKEAFLHGSMQQYYDELTKDIQQVRPWKLAGLRQGLLNDMATFDKIIQETKTSKALEGYYKAGAYELGTRAELNLSEKDLNYSRSLNESLQSFRLQWENDLLANGIDPNKDFWQNTGRLMFSNPDLFRRRMDMFISALNSVDNKIQENLGDHYKRNIALGYGLYKLNQVHQSNANGRSYRNSNAIGAVSKLIPFLGGASSPSPIGFHY